MTSPSASKPSARARRAARAAVVLLLAAVAVAGCRHQPVELSSPRPVWPPPPDRARFEYVQSIYTPRDLGMGGGWLRRALRRFTRGKVVRAMTRPYAVAVAPNGTLVVADPDSRSVHVFDRAHSKYRRLVRAGRTALVLPTGVAVDDQGRLYVADSYHRAVFRFDARGRWLDKLGAEAGLLRPTGLAYDSTTERLYVTDTPGHRIVALGPEGEILLEIGRRGTAHGEFNYPVAVAVDATGRLFVSDSMNFRVQVFDATGRFLRAFGGPGRSPGDFDKSKGIAVDPHGRVYVVDALHDVIQVFDDQGRLLTVLGGSGSNPGEFWLPAGISIDGKGRVFVADTANHRLQVLRYLPGDDEEG